MTVASAGAQYAYDSRNKRVWRSILSGGNLAQQVYVYGVDGQKIGTYTFTLAQYGEANTPEMTNSTVLLAQFFGRKRVGVFDRLGSAKYNQSNNAAQSFYPYGEDRGTVEPNDELKFATYTRDAATGLDYADQRYYANNFGRFTSVDHYAASEGPGDPSSWNRYSYTRGDPINRFDEAGMCDQSADTDTSVTVCGGEDDGSIDPLLFQELYGGNGQNGTHHYVGRVGQAFPGSPMNKLEAALSSGNDLLQNRLTHPSAPCQGDLDALSKVGVSVVGIMGAANLDEWNDAKGDNQLAIGLFVPGSADYNNQLLHGPNETISQYVSGSTAAATALPGSALWGNIYLNPTAFKNLPISDAAGLLMHEVLHTLGLIDPQIQTALWGAGSPQVGAASVNITDKLATDCFLCNVPAPVMWPATQDTADSR